MCQCISNVLSLPVDTANNFDCADTDPNAFVGPRQLDSQGELAAALAQYDFLAFAASIAKSGSSI